MVTSRQAAEESLGAVSLAGLAEPDQGMMVTYSALAGIIAALLDIADAIREQAKTAEPRADIAKDYHTEAIEGIAEAVGEVNITLEAIRNEVADLRCAVAKNGGR